MDTIDIYQNWLKHKRLETTLKRELMKIVGVREEIEDRFYCSLDFGTAGMRGVMGAGTNRMNIYTVGAAAKGFAETIIEDGKEGKGVLISYDSRNNSRLFAEITARIFGTMGVKVYLSDDMRPVPMLSYGIRYYECAAGVMITASHNPPEYNGFKVYGEDGGQLMPGSAARVKARVDAIEDIFGIIDGTCSLNALINDGTIIYIGEELDNAYDAEILSLFKDEGKDISYRSKVKIVYTPLNGCGNIPVRRVLKQLGFDQVFVVPEQEESNGDFPTLKVPNPEMEDAYEYAIKTAEAVHADLILATDPDSDRLGIAVRGDKGDYKVLKGNIIGTLLMEYVLSMKNLSGEITPNSFCATSIVSTKLSKNICRRYGVKLYQVFTGTKYIADKINTLEEHGNERFIFGFEESHGFMLDSNVRDKDAISAAAMISDIAAFSKANGTSIPEQLDSIYSLYGYAADESFSIVCKGEDGKKQISSAMEYYRSIANEHDGRLGAPGTLMSELEITKFTDFLPESNVLMYELGDLDFITMRPSGTEPKLKVYFGFYGDKNKARRRMAKISELVLDDINNTIDSFAGKTE